MSLQRAGSALSLSSVAASAFTQSAIGFTPDLSSIGPECEAIKKVIVEYRTQLYTGAADPDVVIPKLLKDMEAAGLHKVIGEIQRQLDAFLADG